LPSFTVLTDIIAAKQRTRFFVIKADTFQRDVLFIQLHWTVNICLLFYQAWLTPTRTKSHRSFVCKRKRTPIIFQTRRTKPNPINYFLQDGHNSSPHFDCFCSGGFLSFQCIFCSLLS